MRKNGSLRIIAGEYGSRRIEVPPGTVSRPTADRVREAVFSAIAPVVEDAEVLDLFAGSGALSFEAVSRGAASALLCDRDAGACATIEKNIEALGLNGRVQIVRQEAQTLAHALAEEGRAFDLIFLDPPYHAGILDKSIELAALLLRSGGRIVAETDAAYETREFNGLACVFNRKYGETRVAIFMHKEDD